MIEAASTGEAEIEVAAELLLRGGGASAIYDVLDGVAQRHGLSDAWLVLQLPTAGPQVFRRARWSAPAATVAVLASRPAGVYADPPINSSLSRAIALLCEAALRTAFAEVCPTPGPPARLASVDDTDELLARAAARGARYGWVATAVVLTTRGDSPADRRWSVLADALGTALRSGDEAGTVVPGTAVALLPDAGPDAVRPFLARVRAALSAAGGDEIDLVAAVATTPDETVDPVELKQLAWERLVEATGSDAEAERSAGDVTKEVGDARSNGTHQTGSGDPTARWRLELALRQVPGVICVGLSPQSASGAQRALTVVASELSVTMRADIAAVLASHDEHTAVSVHALGGAGTVVVPGAAAETKQAPVAGSSAKMNGDAIGTGGVARAARAMGPRSMAGAGPPPVHRRLLSATAPGTAVRTSRDGSPRVALAHAAFDRDRRVTEVRLELGAASGTGRAPEGPLPGGAKATLTALTALGLDVPYTVVSAERVPMVPGEPVVVVLAPRSHTPGAPDGAGQRMGIAAGDDAEAASRATLGALNRGLVDRAAMS